MIAYSICTDLAVFAEQINHAINEIKKLNSFILDFYEQGIERRINFEYVDEKYKLSCMSFTDWNPLPEIDIEVENISKQLLMFKQDFIELVESKLPQFKTLEMFNRWKSSS